MFWKAKYKPSKIICKANGNPGMQSDLNSENETLVRLPGFSFARLTQS